MKMREKKSDKSGKKDALKSEKKQKSEATAQVYVTKVEHFCEASAFRLRFPNFCLPRRRGMSRSLGT
jgi:hypothetical protein